MPRRNRKVWGRPRWALADFDTSWLFGEERALVAGASPVRRREFTAGRVCARDALQQLGGPRCAILRDPSRAPIWPEGFVGSISHAAGYCVAAAARTAD